MGASLEQPVTVAIDGGATVSGLWLAPQRATACLVLAHGAGAGMAHPFMAAVASALAAREVATLRFQFPYMERGSKRPDAPALAHAAVRAAVDTAARLCPGLPLVAGGKSFGGRMTSQAQALQPLPGVRGLVFFGFPLHPAGKPDHRRADHLAQIEVPMLFLQGTRDVLADLGQLQPVIHGLGERATLALFDDADHSFHVPKRSGRTDAQVLAAMFDRIGIWLAPISGRR